MEYMEFRKCCENESNDMMKSRTEEINSIKKSLCDLFWAGYSQDKLAQLNIIPCDDPLLGKKGYILFREESGNEISINIEMSFSKKAVEVRYDNRNEFNKVFKEAWNSDKPINIYDDPCKYLLGFIVDSRNERIWHNIKLIDFKK